MDILRRVLKIISSAIFTILVIIIVLISVYIVRVKILADNDKLGDVKLNFYTILSQSMYPTIEAGDVVVTYKNSNNLYNKGDVITFISSNNGGVTITHRVKEVYSLNDQISYKTKGDNNNTSDHEVIPSKSVLGKVVLKIPKIGFIQQFLVSKTGWIVAVVLPALGIIIYDILKIFKGVFGFNRKNKNQPDEKDERVLEAKEGLKEVMEYESGEEEIL